MGQRLIIRPFGVHILLRLLLQTEVLQRFRDTLDLIERQIYPNLGQHRFVLRDGALQYGDEVLPFDELHLHVLYLLLVLVRFCSLDHQSLAPADPRLYLLEEDSTALIRRQLITSF